jgi:hypothetical protein
MKLVDKESGSGLWVFKGKFTDGDRFTFLLKLKDLLPIAKQQKIVLIGGLFVGDEYELAYEEPFCILNETTPAMLATQTLIT